MLSCAEREQVRLRTLQNLKRTDWKAKPHIEIDDTTFEQRQERQEHAALRLLREAVARESEFLLFLEDDLELNRNLRHNLQRWYPLMYAGRGDHFFGSIYNPGVAHEWRDDDRAFFVAQPECVYGSQAFILSLDTARYIVAHWFEVPGMQDFKMSRLAARVCSIYYHIPSLVQHVGLVSTWGGTYHKANDYDFDWKDGGAVHREEGVISGS